MKSLILRAVVIEELLKVQSEKVCYVVRKLEGLFDIQVLKMYVINFEFNLFKFDLFKFDSFKYDLFKYDLF